MRARQGLGAAIAGIGEVPTGKYPDRPAIESAVVSAREAVRDAGLTKYDVDIVIPTGTIFSSEFNADMIFSRLVEELGLGGIAKANLQVMSGGSSASTILKVATGLVTAGLARTVLCVNAEKVGTGLPIADAIDTFAKFGISAEWERPWGQNFSAIAGLTQRRYMHETGTTAEQIASVCVALRKWAELNPHAMFRKPLTVEEVLSSKMISDPLHAKESNVLADGGGAFVVTSSERAADITDTPVHLLGFGSRVTHYALSQEPDLSRFGFADAGKEAFEMAGVGPQDINVAEIYDSYPVFNLIALEELGFVERGTAGAFVESGNTWPGGSLPMTTNGGMLSQGHTGVGGSIALVIEAARQLMGKAGERQVPDAHLAVETGTGGSYMDAHVVVMGTEIR